MRFVGGVFFTSVGQECVPQKDSGENIDQPFIWYLIFICGLIMSDIYIYIDLIYYNIDVMHCFRASLTAAGFPPKPLRPYKTLYRRRHGPNLVFLAFSGVTVASEVPRWFSRRATLLRSSLIFCRVSIKESSTGHSAKDEWIPVPGDRSVACGGEMGWTCKRHRVSEYRDVRRPAAGHTTAPHT